MGADAQDWQQFAGQDDRVVFTFTNVGANVHLHAELRTWDARWDADFFGFDAASEQPLFRVPGAEAGAPAAIMLTSFGPGTGFL